MHDKTINANPEVVMGVLCERLHRIFRKTVENLLKSEKMTKFYKSFFGKYTTEFMNSFLAININKCNLQM